MNAYQLEQLETLAMVRSHLGELQESGRRNLWNQAADYLEFRARTAAYMSSHFEGICMDSCYRDRTSACCSKDGIVTFFADVLINALVSTDAEIFALEKSIRVPAYDGKCIFLSAEGCVWRLKPVVCEFFLCTSAKNQVFDEFPEARVEWESLVKLKKDFTWPNQPVLFERLEKMFLSAGFDSPLMYMHKSPGLIRIREKREAHT